MTHWTRAVDNDAHGIVSALRDQALHESQSVMSFRMDLLRSINHKKTILVLSQTGIGSCLLRADAEAQIRNSILG